MLSLQLKFLLLLLSFKKNEINNNKFKIKLSCILLSKDFEIQIYFKNTKIEWIIFYFYWNVKINYKKKKRILITLKY